MKIIDRYVGTSVLVTSLAGVMVLSLVLVVGNVVKELLDKILNHNAPLDIVFAFLAFVLPFSLTFSIPWGFLTGLLLVFGRMSADNELIALRSNGVSIIRICIPVFVLAIALTGICFWINAQVAPRAEQRMSEAIYDIATNNPSALFTADDIIDEFPDRRVYLGGKSGNKLENIIIFEMNEGEEPVKMVHAKEGILTPDPSNTRLLLKLFNARFEERDKDDPRDITKIRQGIVMDEGVFPISLEEFYKEALTNRHISSYTLPELKQFMNDGAGGKPLEAEVEFNKRFSASMACLAFALIAVPLGITAHRKETSVGFALSLVIAFTYFFFIILADTFRSEPAIHPSLLIWVPNFIFITLGIILFARLARR